MYPQTAHLQVLPGMRLPGFASPGAVIDMLEILLVLNGASRAETSLFLFYAAACPLFCKAVRDFFAAVDKTRAHPAQAEPNSFFSVHVFSSRLFIAFSTTYKISKSADVAFRQVAGWYTTCIFFTLTIHYEIMVEHSHLVFSIACSVLVILACTAVGCSSSQTTTPAASPSSSVGGNTISIKNFAFRSFHPDGENAGTAVTWMNNDGAPHTIVSDTGAPAAISSDTLSSGASFTFTFTQPGTYIYHCSIHPSMKGTVIVQ